MVAIQDALIAQGDVARCVYSDTNADKLMMRIVFSPDVVKNMLTLRYMEERILDVVISGVDGVQGVYQRDVNKEMTWDDSISGYVSKKQHVLDVEGSGILYSLLAFPNVDPTRTFSNDIHEVMDVFGIEAARQALYDEFWEVLSAAYVNYHHMSVLLDAMTYQGRLVSVDRFGMGKHDNGVLAKSWFEETSRILFNAAVSSEFDPMKGVSANIMFGQKAPCGTGMVEILLDETRLPEGEEEIFQDYREQQQPSSAPASTEGGTECRVEDINMW
jgi:DNA-directed RNA polymerase II subunit RPB1